MPDPTTKAGWLYKQSKFIGNLEYDRIYATLDYQFLAFKRSESDSYCISSVAIDTISNIQIVNDEIIQNKSLPTIAIAIRRPAIIEERKVFLAFDTTQDQNDWLTKIRSLMPQPPSSHSLTNINRNHSVNKLQVENKLNNLTIKSIAPKLSELDIKDCAKVTQPASTFQIDSPFLRNLVNSSTQEIDQIVDSQLKVKQAKVDEANKRFEQQQMEKPLQLANDTSATGEASLPQNISAEGIGAISKSNLTVMPSAQSIPESFQALFYYGANSLDELNLFPGMKLKVLYKGPEMMSPTSATACIATSDKKDNFASTPVEEGIGYWLAETIELPIRKGWVYEMMLEPLETIDNDASADPVPIEPKPAAKPSRVQKLKTESRRRLSLVQRIALTAMGEDIIERQMVDSPAVLIEPLEQAEHIHVQLIQSQTLSKQHDHIEDSYLIAVTPSPPFHPFLISRSFEDFCTLAFNLTIQCHTARTPIPHLRTDGKLQDLDAWMKAILELPKVVSRNTMVLQFLKQ